jgi:DNA-binding CsgD family transcriptional regulator
VAVDNCGVVMGQTSGVEPEAGWGLDREVASALGVTRREGEVLEAVAARLSNAEVAAKLFISERTVESHVTSLLRKLGVSDRAELIERARAVAATTVGRGDVDRPGLPVGLARLCEDGPWFGRQAELGELVGKWHATVESRVVVVRGEAGIGKSRLVAEFAAEVQRRGGMVAVGACVDGPQRPFEPFVAGLVSIGVDIRDDAILGRLVASEAAVVEVIDAQQDRYAVQRALCDAMASAVGPGGLLFVVEDLHWASEATPDVLEVLARTPRRARLLVVGTTRDHRAVASDRYAAYLGRLARSPSVTTLPLTGLDLGAPTELIDAVGSSLNPADGVARSGGNPLFLRQLARHGAASRSMGEAVADLFSHLDPGDVDIVDTAVAWGDPIDVAVVAVATGRRRADVLDSLERAEALGIVRGDTPGFVFSAAWRRSSDGRPGLATPRVTCRAHAAGSDRCDAARGRCRGRDRRVPGPR